MGHVVGPKRKGFEPRARGEGSLRRPDSCQIKNDGEITLIRENNYRIGSSVLASLKNSLLVSSTARPQQDFVGYAQKNLAGREFGDLRTVPKLPR